MGSFLRFTQSNPTNTLSNAQFLALRDFVDHIAQSNCGPQMRKGVMSSSPRTSQVATYRSLVARGFIEATGTAHEHEAGNFRWKMPAYRLTESGRVAILAALKDADITKANPTETYVAAKARLLQQLKLLNWTTSPFLKVPWAEPPSKDFKIWFKAQAVYLNDHSLFIDIRGMDVNTFIQQAVR